MIVAISIEDACVVRDILAEASSLTPTRLADNARIAGVPAEEAEEIRRHGAKIAGILGRTSKALAAAIDRELEGDS